MSRFFASLTLLALLGSIPAQAQQANSPEAKMREQLRSTMLQLRAAETERATLQASQAEAAEQNKALTEKLESLTKQSAANQEASEKTITELNGRVADRETKIAQLDESLAKWKKAYEEAAELARKKEGERAALNQEKIELQRVLADQRTKNAAMFKIGNEILTRYEKFGLGTALGAREPFVGTTRVKLQNLVQDYSDKLADERIKPQEAPPAPEPKAKAQPEKARGRKAQS
jgi:DNA repair exonuclease SbcCD ATPase subunit